MFKRNFDKLPNKRGVIKSGLFSLMMMLSVLGVPSADAVPAGSQVTGNLVVNGDFALGATGWISSSGSTVVCSGTGVQVHPCTTNGNVTFGLAIGSISQTVTLPAGTTGLSLSVDHLSGGQSDGVSIEVIADTGGSASLAKSKPSVSSLVNLTVSSGLVGSKTATIILRDTTGNGWAGHFGAIFDNVVLTATYGNVSATPVAAPDQAVIADPVKDTTVIGQIGSHASTVGNVVSAQSVNISSHINQLHSNFSDMSGSNNLSIRTSAEIQQILGVSKSLAENLIAPGAFMVASAGDALPAAPAPVKLSRFWAEGTISYGSMNADNKFKSSGLTVGMDYGLNDDLIVGAALGLGWDSSKVDVQGTKSVSMTPTLSLYGSYKPFENTFIDAWAGYGYTHLNNQRWVAADNVIANGDRGVNSYFGSISGSSNFEYEEFRFEPYIRGEVVHSKFKAYQEFGVSNSLLSYNAMNYNAYSAAAGLMVHYDYKTSFGILTPRIKGEYKSTSYSGGVQDMYYSDTANTIYSLGLTGAANSIVSSQIALLYSNEEGMNGEVGFDFAKGNSSYISRTFNVRASVMF